MHDATFFLFNKSKTNSNPELHFNTELEITANDWHLRRTGIIPKAFGTAAGAHCTIKERKFYLKLNFN